MRTFGVTEFLRVGERLRNVGGRAAAPEGDRPLLSPEDFQEELVVLGLSGMEFAPEDYARALGRRLGVEICLCFFADADHPELARALAVSGKVAELCYSEDRRTAVVLIPQSLPPAARTLAAYHELGHLAAGDLLGKINGRGLARRPPLTEERLREREADLRAEYAMLAGSLGAASPHAIRMNDVL